jgi:diguanylate cyclase (GGDEF)-like protein/PAS domain S-box-containing protein
LKKHIFRQLKDIKAWLLKLYIVLFSVLMTEIIVASMGMLLKGYVPVDYLLTGLVASFFVAFLVVTILLQFREQFIESQLQLHTIIDTEPECVKLMAADGSLLQINRAGLMLIEADSASQVIGHCVQQIILPQYRAAFMALTKQVFAGGTANLEFEIQGLKGTHRWLDTHAVPLRDGDGNITALLSVTRDITERKQAQQVQQEILERFEKIASRIPGMVYQYRLNPDGSTCLPYASPAIQDIFHLTPEDVRDSATKIDALHHPEDHEQIVASIHASAQNLTPWQHEYRIRFEDGSERWLLGNALPEREADGATLWHGFITDITESKQASQQLQKSEKQLQLVLEGGHLGFWDWNLLTNEVQRNTIWAEMLGYTYEEMKNTTQQWEDFVHLDDRERAWQSIDNALKGDTPYHEAEYRMLYKDGSIRWILDHASVVQRDANGQPTRMTGTHTDITQLKRMEQQLRDSEAFTTSIIDSLTSHIAVLDAQGKIIAVNNAWLQFGEDNGLHEADYSTLGVNYLDVCQKAINGVNSEESSEVKDGIIAVLAGSLDYFYLEYPCHAPTQNRWFCLNVSPLKGSRSGVVISHENITIRKQAESQLRISATVFEAQEGMLITNTDGVILNVNQAFTQITGYSVAEAIGQTPRLLRSGRHDKAFYVDMWRHILDAGVWKGEVWNQRKNGDIYPQWMTITAVKSNNDTLVTHYVATLTDITERKLTEEHINQLAFYDPLTQLPNRRLLQERLRHAIDVSHRTGNQVAVLMLDLDKFKAVNDNFGHTVGDELLQQVAVRIKARLRETDTVVRLGGDEFVVLMEEIEHYEHVSHVASDLIATLTQLFTVRDNCEAYIGVSIGIAIYPQHGDSVEALLDNADVALYHAKDEGRGCFAYFSEELTQKARERIALEVRLRRAIEQHELEVYFQAQVDINSGRIIGAEALVRWHDPVKGFVTPSEFIPLAEETGLIIPLGEFVLKETCRLGRQWLDDGLPAITLAVNVSPHQFRRSDINALVAEVLHDTGFPAEYLELEITESGLMDNQQHAMTILNTLHNQGVRIAIDDFGTGYSSLAYLKYFPLDVLKIDKTFIDDIPFLQGDMAITAAIIAMAHHLGFKVLAEGVENAEQLAFLRQHGCDMYQGYFCSKPVPASDFMKLLLNGLSSSTP